MIRKYKKNFVAYLIILYYIQLWKNYVEQPEEANNNTSKPVHEDVVKERKTNYVEVLVSEVNSDLHVYVQPVSEGPKLESLTDNLRKHFDSNPPTAGSYNPKRGKLQSNNLYIVRDNY